MADKSPIVWMELQYCKVPPLEGFNYDKQKILEISCVITDHNLNITKEGPTLIIQQEKQIFDTIPELERRIYTNNGLKSLCENSTITIAKAQEILLTFLKTNVKTKSCPLAGRAVSVDRLVLRHYMPEVDDYLMYRCIDVTCVKELCRRWRPEILQNLPAKDLTHRCLEDLNITIAELNYFKENFIIKSE